MNFKWTFILSEENRWCGILMTLAARSRKSVVRLQTCIKCGKSLVEHSMSLLATGSTTAKIKKKWNWFYFWNVLSHETLTRNWNRNICLIRRFMVKTANFELQKKPQQLVILYCFTSHSAFICIIFMWRLIGHRPFSWMGPHCISFFFYQELCNFDKICTYSYLEKIYL